MLEVHNNASGQPRGGENGMAKKEGKIKKTDWHTCTQRKPLWAH